MPLEAGEAIDTDLANGFPTKYVAFLDLLGFSDLVGRSEADVDERQRLVEALKLLRDTLCENPATDLRFTYFSDCVVISAKQTPQGLWEIFRSLEVLTCNLLQYDILVRGGLTVGPTYHSRDFVFGAAVTQAHELECEYATNPLVLLSSDVVKAVQALGSGYSQWLRKDGPDRFFFHYLIGYAGYSLSRRVGEVILTYPAQRIAYFVGTRLRNDKDGILKKAEWLQKYWNEAVASQGVLPRIDADSQLVLPPYSVTIIKRRLTGPSAE